jgi:hypothetical protein
MNERKPPTKDEEIVRDYPTNKLFDRNFGNDRFFFVILDDENGFEIQLAPKTLLKVGYKFDRNDIEGLHITKIIGEKETQRLDLNRFNIQQLLAFLNFISAQNLEDIPEKRISLVDNQELTYEVKTKIRQLLYKEGGEELIQSLLDEGVITSRDVVNTAYRKRQLGIFEKMLSVDEFWREYANEESISSYSEEKVWQHFFWKNNWIFGYGLDYRFEGILQKEFYASVSS